MNMSMPRERKRADYRVIARILQLSHGQSDPENSLLENISIIFTRKGGSWVLFFQGHPKHCKLLKTVIKSVVKYKKEQHERRNRRKTHRED